MWEPEQAHVGPSDPSRHSTFSDGESYRALAALVLLWIGGVDHRCTVYATVMAGLDGWVSQPRMSERLRAERAAYVLLLSAAPKMLAARLGAILDADVETNDAELGELARERGRHAIGARLADHRDSADAVGIELLTDGADALQRQLLARENEVVIVEAEDAAPAGRVEEQRSAR